MSEQGLPSAVDVVVVGGGFSGIGTAIRLRQMGVEDFVVLDRGSEVGGTWRDNTYPGATCDVPSHLYSFSFAPNPEWSRSFSPQSEIWSYMRGVVDRFGVGAHFRFGQDVTEARFDETEQRWHVTTAHGSLTARIVVWATGPLSEPKVPDLPGLANFAGPVFHSAAWDHGADLAGKRVAVVGTGASAIQFVPQIQPLVAKLYLHQRTPPWIIPRNDRDVPPARRWLFRHLPFTQKMARLRIYLRLEYLMGPVVLGTSERKRQLLRKFANGHLHHQIDDPELRSALTPDYEIGCKRILVSDDYYPSLTRANVEVVPAVGGFTPDGVVDDHGVERQVDMVIMATGFQAAEPSFATRIVGPGGARLSEAWDTGMEAYLGSTVTGFPNLFLLVGPNTTLGHNSMIYMIESQLNYVVDAIGFLGRPGVGTVDVRPAVLERYNRRLQGAIGPTVWVTGGCTSWYLDHRGVNTTLWPRHTAVFRRLTRRFHPADYTVGPPGPPGARRPPVRARRTPSAT